MSKHAEKLAEKIEENIHSLKSKTVRNILEIFLAEVNKDSFANKAQCHFEWQYGVDLLNQDENDVDFFEREEVFTSDFVYEFSETRGETTQVRVSLKFSTTVLDLAMLPENDGFRSALVDFRLSVIESDIFAIISDLEPEYIRVFGELC